VSKKWDNISNKKERKLCRIRHLSRAGYNQNQIAKRMGFSRQHIQQLVNPDYMYKPKGCKMARHDRTQVASLLRWQGWTIQEIAEYIEVKSVGTVSNRIPSAKEQYNSLLVYYRNKLREEVTRE
jgi:transposase